MMYYNPDHYPELSEPIQEAIKRGDTEFFEQIPDAKRDCICRSHTKLF